MQLPTVHDMGSTDMMITHERVFAAWNTKQVIQRYTEKGSTQMVFQNFTCRDLQDDRSCSVILRSVINSEKLIPC